MNTKYLKILASLFIAMLSACGGCSISDSDDVFVSLDATVDYDIAKTLPGTPGLARTGSAIGTETDVSVWTYSSIISSKFAIANTPRSRVPANLLKPLFGQYY